MSTLVPIPWQPSLYLTPSTLSYLVAASSRLGRHLFLQGSDAAHRTFARQDFLYQGYLKKLAGVPGYEKFNTASSPNPPGQRSHMRGAAFDLIDTSAAVQAACRAVGLVRDGVETWHWNDPNWASMPIIPTNTVAADVGSGPTPVSSSTKNPLGDDMSVVIQSSIGSTVVIDGIAIGGNSPDEIAAVHGMQVVSVSGRQHTEYLRLQAQKSGLPLLVFLSDAPGVYALLGGKLVAQTPASKAALSAAGSLGVSLTTADIATWPR